MSEAPDPADYPMLEQRVREYMGTSGLNSDYRNQWVRISMRLAYERHNMPAEEFTDWFHGPMLSYEQHFALDVFDGPPTLKLSDPTKVAVIDHLVSKYNTELQGGRMSTARAEHYLTLFNETWTLLANG